MIKNVKENSDNKSLRSKVVKRSVMTVAMFIAMFHLFATFLWIAPASDLRSVIPNGVLTKYMIPFFGQSWSVFAPEPINGDYYFDVRAVVKNSDGSSEITEWVRATDVEIDKATYNLFPPRAAGLGMKVSSDLKGSWDKLSNTQKSTIELDYFKGDDYGRLSKNLKTVSSNDSLVYDYIKKEKIATAYATQVSKAIWGDNVIRVQYQASRQNVVPYSERNNDNAVRPGYQIVSTGWRGLLVKDNQSDEKFAEYFCNSDKVRCVK